MSVRTTTQQKTKKNKVSLAKSKTKKNSVVGSEVSYICVETG